MATYTAPGLDHATAEKVCSVLQDRLHSLTDLHLTLKHIHWNVVGPNFIAVHEMLDPQVETVRGFADDLAERIATLGGEPLGTPGAVVQGRRWGDYELTRATAAEHLEALDHVYVGLIEDHRKAFEALDELDQVSNSMLIDQTEKLEMYQWFGRAHLEDKEGRLPS